ncbi:hypothetical protein LINPERPRIM_LOCUS30743 [Linum perenne]
MDIYNGDNATLASRNKCTNLNFDFPLWILYYTRAQNLSESGSPLISKRQSLPFEDTIFSLQRNSQENHFSIVR